MQHDAAGAAPNLGAFLAPFPCRRLPRSSDAASGAADAERSAAYQSPFFEMASKGATIKQD